MYITSIPKLFVCYNEMMHFTYITVQILCSNTQMMKPHADVTANVVLVDQKL